MGMNPKDIPVTRETIHGWLNEPGMKASARKFLQRKVDELNLPDRFVDLPDRGSISLVDLILEDLPSYGY